MKKTITLELTKKEVEDTVDFLGYASEHYLNEAGFGPADMRQLERRGEKANSLSYKIAEQLEKQTGMIFPRT
jgi:hypothetical protein